MMHHSSSYQQHWLENHRVLLQNGDVALYCASESAERYLPGSTFTCSNTSQPLSLLLKETEMVFTHYSCFLIILIQVHAVGMQENTCFITEMTKTNTFRPTGILELSVHLISCLWNC